MIPKKRPEFNREEAKSYRLKIGEEDSVVHSEFGSKM